MSSRKLSCSIGVKFSNFGLLICLLVPVTGLTACQSDSSGRPSSSLSPTSLEGRFKEADEQFVLREYEKAIDSYAAIHSAAKARGREDMMIEAAAQLSSLYAIVGKMEASEDWYERARPDASESHPASWTRVLLADGVRAWRQEQADLARGTFVRLYNYCQLHGRTPRAIQAAYLVAQVSHGQEKLDWVKRAISAAESTGNARWQADLWFNHGQFLERDRRYDEALASYSEAREIAAKGLPRADRLKMQWAYGRGLRLVGRLEEAKDVLIGENAKWQSIYTQKPSPRAAEFLGRVIAELGEIDAANGNIERAKTRFESAITRLTEAGAIQDAPGEIRRLRERLEELDRPPSNRRIPVRAPQ